MGLTLWVGVRKRLFRSPSRLALVLYHDGIMHYIYLSCERLFTRELKPLDLLMLVFASTNLIMYVVAPVCLEASQDGLVDLISCLVLFSLDCPASSACALPSRDVTMSEY